MYTEPELNLYRKKPSSLAARFAGKEAVHKALKNAHGISWKQIEVLSDPDGRPLLSLYGKAKEQAQYLGLTSLDISLAHSKEYAIAFVGGASEDRATPEAP